MTVFDFGTMPQTRETHRVSFVNFFTKEGKEIDKREAISLLTKDLVVAYIKCDQKYGGGVDYAYHVCDANGLIFCGCFPTLAEAITFANPSVYEYRGEKMKVTNGAITIGYFQDGCFTSFESPKEAEEYWTDVVATISVGDPALNAKIDSVMDFRKP